MPLKANENKNKFKQTIMLTMFLSAICALTINASAMTTPADTVERYVINDKLVEKFDGSQLVGKTVSDYKVTVAKSNGSENVVRVHVIRTDGQTIKDIKSVTSVEGLQVGNNNTEFTIDGKKYTNSKVTVVSSTAVYIIDGKECTTDDLKKIKPNEISAMTVYKPGSKEAKELSGKDNVTVIKVDLKK